jgi:hypothetical protein
MRVVTAVLSNWDMCGAVASTMQGCPRDPLSKTISRVAALAGNGSAALASTNERWWSAFWNATSISLPGDPVLERFYYGQSYLIASSARKGKVPPGLFGPFVHTDVPYWFGGFTIDYNFLANYYGVYANNRLDLAWSQYAPLMNAVPDARRMARYYSKYYSSNNRGSDGCPNATHFPGGISPFGFMGESLMAGNWPNAAMSINSNALLASLNMLRHWEYTRDEQFLATIAFPFTRDALAFYMCWMRRLPDGSAWLNERDQSHECTPRGQGDHGVPVTEAGKVHACYQNNTVIANGFIRRAASMLPSMARILREPVDPRWAEINATLPPQPIALSTRSNGPNKSKGPIFVLAGKYSDMNCSAAGPGAQHDGPDDELCGTRSGGRCVDCDAQRTNAMDVEVWSVFPTEVINVASPPNLIQTTINTLENDVSWLQGNSFCTVFSQAARVGMPLNSWLPSLHEAMRRK